MSNFDEEESLSAGNGMPGTAIAGAAREVFLTILCQPVTDPSEAMMDKWLDCLAIVLTLCERESGVSWVDLARRLALQFHGRDRWEELGFGYQLAWEAAARTMVNWCVVEDVEDRRAMERYDWKAWALAKLTGANDE